jgi:hypothetical protein
MPAASPALDPRAPPRASTRGWVLFLLGCGVGGVAGFGAGVASVKAAREWFASAFEDEQAAEVAAPKTLERPGFELRYPQNWHVDTASANYDPDHMFSIDSPGQSFVMFVVATGALDPQTAIDAHVSQQTAKVMHDATRAPFEKWGAYSGAGVLLTGKKLGLAPGTIRVFAARVDDRTFTVIESTTDDDRDKVEPGFALIERTFHMKEAPSQPQP